MARKKRSIRRLGAIERDILEDLSGGDLLYGFLLSGRSSRHMFKLARERATYRYRRKLAIARLKELNFIESRDRWLRITAEGGNLLGKSIALTRALVETKKWDGKWRIATFDIPEKYAPLRNRVRGLLKRAGFVQLQQSIWIFPYDCEELVQLIKTESDLSKHILYGVLEEIEDDERLKKRFGLA